MFGDSSDEACNSRRKLLDVVPIFESENEREYFERYIKLNMSNILESLNISIEENDFLDITDDNQHLKKVTQRSLSIDRALVTTLKEFSVEKGVI